MKHTAGGHLMMQLIHPSEPAGKFHPLCQHSTCSGLQIVGDKHREIGSPPAIRVLKGNTFNQGTILH